MPKPLALPARQVTALCKGAAKAGYIPVVEISGVTIRLVPEDSVPEIQDKKPKEIEISF